MCVFFCTQNKVSCELEISDDGDMKHQLILDSVERRDAISFRIRLEESDVRELYQAQTRVKTERGADGASRFTPE